MDINLKDLLKTSRVFSSLGESASQRLLSKCSQVHLGQGEILFYQGDASDSVYLLVSGKLVAFLTVLSGQARTVGYVLPGETVGELGAIVNEPRSLSIKALKDSILLKISTRDFIEICHQYPAVMFAALHPIITRSTNLLQIFSAEKANKHIVLVPANGKTSLEAFFHKIFSYAEKFSNLLVVSDYQTEFQGDLDIVQIKEKIQQLGANKRPTAKIAYILSSYNTPLAKVAFKKANAVYIVGHGDEMAKIDQEIVDKIEGRRLYLRSNPELILLHKAGTLAPKHTARWLVLTDFSLHHHVRMDVSRDFHRVLRFIRGKAVGLVLSGGGTRGWAHIGVIKALREAKIPIDMIGGTSAGAVAAACYAIHQSPVDAYDKFYDIVTGSAKTIAWYNITWPAISLFSAKNFTTAQQKVFGDQRIEDLWLPYFCVSCNLSKNREEVHTRGVLWEKIRASTSIPGLIPPMLLDEDIHLDGGLLNNLPVDVMREFVGRRGKIIGVELNSFVTQKHHYAFPPILTLKDIIFSKLGLGPYKYRFPRFLDTFLRGLFMSSVTKTRQNSLAANIFINLDLRAYRFLDSNPKFARGIMEAGYKQTLKEIHERKKKLSGEEHAKGPE